MRILVLEDDPHVSRQIAARLNKAGYVVDLAYDGEEGWFLGDTETYDAAVLDLGLPHIDGLTVLGRWRAAGRKMPVLILTARDTWREKVQGLRAGADDYLAKPFEIEEMLARIEALIRRASGHATPILHSGDIELDTATGRVMRAGQPVELTALEHRALSYLMHHPDKVISKTELAEHIYDHGFDYDSNVIEALIWRLRSKLGDHAIKTLRGRGYCLQTPDDDTP